MSVATPIDSQPSPDTDSSVSAAARDFRERPDDRSPPELSVWAVVIAAVPFLCIPVAHLLSAPETATGLFHYELPYYVANGRAAFERGNGLLYPNPFDPAVDAPAIYVHWLPEILGAATAVLGADPGSLIAGLTFAAAMLLSYVSGRLVLGCLPPNTPFRPFALLAAMWGGGLLAAGGVAASLTSGTPQWDILQLDPGNGMWFLNWGRNALFPTEAIYHALCAGCWLNEIRGRQRLANVFLTLLATTHPWSGLELLLTINLWRGLMFLMHRNRAHAIPLAFSGTLLVVFLTYYKLWLPTFPQHAALQTVWELDWSLASTSAVAAWSPVALAAVWRLWKHPEALQTRTVQFLIGALVVALGLSLHDRLIKPVQPLHFTRGYVWMPLFLLGAPVILSGLHRLWTSSLSLRGLAICLMLAFVADNLVFAVIQCRHQLAQEDGFHLDVHDRALMGELHERYPNEVLLTESDKINYLLPAYANLRPWLGHQFNTPEFAERSIIKDTCFANGTVAAAAVPSDVTLLAAENGCDFDSVIRSGQWLPAEIANAKWTVWRRVSP